MTVLSDAAIADALTRTCRTCGVPAGFECLDFIGRPLVESDAFGSPVHDGRVEP